MRRASAARTATRMDASATPRRGCVCEGLENTSKAYPRVAFRSRFADSARKHRFRISLDDWNAIQMAMRIKPYRIVSSDSSDKKRFLSPR